MQALAREITPIAILIFAISLMLFGTQCAPEFREEPLKLPDKSPVVIAAKDSQAEAGVRAGFFQIHYQVQNPPIT